MYLLIDNFDSFVYNLKAYLEDLGETVLVRSCDSLTLSDIETLHPQGIILSPGPKRPWDATLCVEVVKHFQGKIPILGVCLGHQVIGYCAGAVVEKGTSPMHGKITGLTHNGTRLFAGLPEQFFVTRYHSLVIKPETLPADYRIDAFSPDGAVMGISHKKLPIYGVQFHPEAVLTEYGHELLHNFCRLAEAFPKQQNQDNIPDGGYTCTRKNAS